MDRRRERKNPEPALYGVVKQVAVDRIAVFSRSSNLNRLEEVLAGAATPDDLGRSLVRAFGVRISRELVGAIAGINPPVIQGQEDPVFKRAKKWAEKTSENIKDDGWHEPERGTPESGPQGPQPSKKSLRRKQKAEPIDWEEWWRGKRSW